MPDLVSPTVRPEPVLPDYSGACVANIVPALLQHADVGRPWMPEAALAADQVVLLVLDGLGAEQLADRLQHAPALASMEGESITTIAPSTTASALTSISTGLAPSQHGVVGYRIRTGGETLNVLRWSTGSGDARERIPAAEFQTAPTFAERHPTVITRSEFRGSGFTLAHLADTDLVGYKLTSTLVTEVAHALDRGTPFVYAYYDGIDKIAHEYGLTDHYTAELVATDRLVADLLAVLPAGAVLLVTADHGQVHIGDATVQPDPTVLELVAAQSGEARFRWLHAKPGRAAALLDAAVAAHSELAWIYSRDELVDRRIFGPPPSSAVLDRLGDVALVPFEPVAFIEPTDGGSVSLIGRHGSLTSAEMRVPLLIGGPT